MFVDLPPAQVYCLAEVIYLEARGEEKAGQRAVAHVVLNRSKKTKKTICQVVREPRQFQVNFRKSYVGKTWADVYKIASNPGIDPTHGATSFKTAYSRAKWSLKFLVRIGGHNFYK